MKAEKKPGKLLRQLEARSIEVASRRPLEKDLGSGWSGIGFSLCGQQMVAPMGEVVEIIHVPSSTYIPGVCEWMLGIANVRGRLLSLVDLENFYGARLAGNRNGHRALIVEHGNYYIGLVVSKVFGLKHFAADAFDNKFDHSLELFSSCIQGKGSDGESDWLRFSPRQLIKDTNFSDASVFGQGVITEEGAA